MSNMVIVHCGILEIFTDDQKKFIVKAFERTLSLILTVPVS